MKIETSLLKSFGHMLSLQQNQLEYLKSYPMILNSFETYI